MKKLYHIIFISLLTMTQSCLEPVDIDLPGSGNSKLVVVSNFTNSHNFQVIVSKTSSINESEVSRFVTNATVSIYSDGELMEILTPFPADSIEVSPYYASQTLVAEIGKLYKIHVEAPGFEPVTSYGLIPAPSSLISSQFEQNDDGGNGGSSGGGDTSAIPNSYLITVEINDPKRDENYYHLNFYQEVRVPVNRSDGGVELVNKSYGPLVMANPDVKEQVTFYFNNRGAFINDRGFNGQVKKITLETFLDVIPSNGQLGKIIIELRTVSKEYYLYYLTLLRQNQHVTDPQAEPVIDFTNIENGTGIFAGFSVVTDTLTLFN